MTRHLRRSEDIVASTPKKVEFILFKGLMATGKSTLSCALGKSLGWPVVDKDDFSDILINKIEQYGPLAYEAMFSVSQSLLQQGFNVICDSPLRGQVGYLNAKQLAAEVGAELRVVVCTCSDETLWRERLETRTRRPAHILKTWDDLERYKVRALADFDYKADVPTLEVDMVNPLNDVVEEVITWLEYRQIEQKEHL